MVQKKTPSGDASGERRFVVHGVRDSGSDVESTAVVQAFTRVGLVAGSLNWFGLKGGEGRGEAGAHSEEAAHAMLKEGLQLPGDDAVTQQLHGKLFTHHVEISGEHQASYLNLVKPEEPRKYFDPNTSSQHWPNLILTSSHANVWSHDDVVEPMEGFRSLVRHSFSSKKAHPPKLALIEDTAASLPKESSVKPTVMIAAVDHAPVQDTLGNERASNLFVNGARLIFRLRWLEALDERLANEPNIPQSELEKCYVEGNPNKTGEAKGAISPASIELKNLMLSVLVKEPTKLKGHDSEAVIETAKPLHLREDADEVMRHIKLVGYSRGGSIVTDALRLLTLQLQHEKDGKRQMLDADGQAVTDARISQLVQNTGIVCVNPGIFPLSARDQALGMRRVTIRSDADVVSRHFFEEAGKKDRFKHRHDTVYVVPSGTHDIKAALGTQEKPGYILDDSSFNSENKKAVEDFRSHMQAFFASCHDKLGVSHVYLGDEDVEGQAKPCCRFQFSSGVSDAIIGRYAEELVQACTAQGLSDVSLDAQPTIIEGKKLYTLHYAEDAKAPQKIANALDSFSHPIDEVAKKGSSYFVRFPAWVASAMNKSENIQALQDFLQEKMPNEQITISQGHDPQGRAGLQVNYSRLLMQSTLTSALEEYVGTHVQRNVFVANTVYQSFELGVQPTPPQRRLGGALTYQGVAAPVGRGESLAI